MDNTKDILRITKDEKFINERLEFLNSDEGIKSFEPVKSPLYTANGSIHGYSYYYVSNDKNKHGIILKLYNNSCILIEINIAEGHLYDISPLRYLTNLMRDYFTEELESVGIDRIDIYDDKIHKLVSVYKDKNSSN